MFVQKIVDFLVVFATDFLMPVMGVVFLIGVTARALIWWTVKREYWFSEELEKRIQRYINSVEDTKNISFFLISKRLLEITFYEIFEVRAVMKRRNPDVVMHWADRVFLIQQGCARTVNDILRKIRYYRFNAETPKFLELSKNVLQNNPCFNRIFGIIPISGLNDLLNILPNLFIVGGIFGTFLGIMKALPELSGMDLSDVENSKMVMDTFLLKISFSMSTSIMGIVLSVSMTLLNTFLSAEKQFVMTIENFTESFNTLWSISDHNELPQGELELTDNDDPLFILAEDVVARELNVGPGFVKLTKPIQGWWLRPRNQELHKENGENKEEEILKEGEKRESYSSNSSNSSKGKVEKMTPPSSPASDKTPKSSPFRVISPEGEKKERALKKEKKEGKEKTPPPPALEKVPNIDIPPSLEISGLPPEDAPPPQFPQGENKVENEQKDKKDKEEDKAKVA